MIKKRVLAALLALTMTLCLTACGSGGGEKNENAGGETVAESSDSSAAEESSEEKDLAEESDDEDASEVSSTGSLTEEFEFTKTAAEEALEKPITACGLQFDENEDRKYENTLDQERESFILHIGILSAGYDMEDYLAKSQADNYQYATAVSRGYNIQQADAANSDGSAKFTVIRYTKFEDGGENDYQYMGELVYTDGTSVAATEFLYSVDKEYGNGEEVETGMKAITGHYGIDYDKLDWVDQESSAK